MAKKQIDQALAKLLRSATSFNPKLTSQERFWLMRSGFVGRSSQPEGGFILPTVTLLLLMLSLVLGILIFRTGNRSIEIIGERQQRQVYNAATPAVERAKAKLEYLFSEEPLPALPSEDQLEEALTDGQYQLGDEQRLDLNGDGTDDNAWSFRFDSDGDGAEDTVVAYSILTRSVADDGAGGLVEIQDGDEDKAENLVVRNGPINLTGQGVNPNCPDPGRSLYVGWEQISGGTLRKAIQVHAFAKSLNAGNSSIATLEMQQDKQANLGNKWGAWFRYDLEVFPGPNFNWNGAMYTAGNFMMTNNGTNALTLFPVSDETSCIYTEDSSELAMGEFDIATNGTVEGQTAHGWQGQFLAGSMKENDAVGSVNIILFEDENGTQFPIQEFSDGGGGNREDDSTDQDPAEIALNPVLVLTEDINRTRATSNLEGDLSAKAYRDADWNNKFWVRQSRPHNDQEATPFVDDTFRADNRWGPKPVYRKLPEPVVEIPDGINVTDPESNSIAAAADELVRDAPPPGVADEQTYGLDGYWERRARAQGVRIIAGQRLQLGNAFGWGNKVSEADIGLDLNGNNGTNDIVTMADVENNAVDDATRDSFVALAATKLLDPLYPAPPEAAGNGWIARGNPLRNNANNRETEQRQWKSMRDNLAAAQSTAVYHYLMDEGQYPVTCLASTAHPGSRDSIRNSTTFAEMDLPGGGTGPNVDFLNGRGTNGWEFYPPLYAASTVPVTDGLLSRARVDFASAINDNNSPLRIALENLAYFSGDLAGAYPPFQDVRGGVNAANDNRFTDNSLDAGVGAITHPYPIQTMWGDFSNLRRVIEQLNNTSAYGNPGVASPNTYDELSLADQTTLQTASCTLGMLAYNVNNVLNDPNGADDSIAGERKIVNALRDLQVNNDIEIRNAGGDTFVDLYQVGNPDPTYTAKIVDPDEPLFNLDNLAASTVSPVALLDAIAPQLTDEENAQLKAIHDKHQIIRDRTQGFSAAGYLYTTISNQNILGQTINAGTEVRLQCDFEANEYFGLNPTGSTMDSDREAQFLTVAFAVCPTGPKYPSLAYLFPVADRAHDGALSTNIAAGDAQEFFQPLNEPYTSSDLRIDAAESEPDGNGLYEFHNRYALRRPDGPLVERPNGAPSPTGNRPSQGINHEGNNQRFRVVGDGNAAGGGGNGVEDAGDVTFTAISLQPKPQAVWALPSTTTATGRINKVVFVEDATTGAPTSTSYWTALLDKGFFNGRESLNTNVLDIDLDLLRRNTVTGPNAFRNDQVQTDFWLPLPEIADPSETSTRTGAIIYAFREDTVREDGIARPRIADDPYTTWVNEWRDYSRENFNNAYIMNAIGVGGQFSDPPANPNNGLSPKAVDFYADPERRPSGFRLRNGQDLRRINGGDPWLTNPARDDEPELRGMSFISDAPVYIQGDFNLHTRSNGVGIGPIIEEYTETSRLADDWNNFFNRSADDLDPDFARETDSWRATEIISDAVTILSNAFEGTANNSDNWFAARDGWLKQSWLNTNGGNDNDNTSFMQFTRPGNNRLRNNYRWVLENGMIDGGLNSGDTGIKVSQRGFPIYCAEPDGDNNTALDDGDNCIAMGGIEREYGLYNNQTFERITDGRRRAQTGNNNGGTRVNAVVVSGTVPSRAGNSYGGLHNFPRFLERWRQPLRFSGSLFQLNFSASATAPFDLDSWEPRRRANANQEPIPYYGPPDRLWGYDVALQYVPAAPVAERFSTRDNIRSEFYRELAADDYYVMNLRCADDPQDPGNQIDPNAQCN